MVFKLDGTYLGPLAKRSSHDSRTDGLVGYRYQSTLGWYTRLIAASEVVIVRPD